MSAGRERHSSKSALHSRVIRHVIIVVSSLILIGLAFLITMQSTLNPWSIHYPGSDSSLYVYAGTQILDGIIPYRDMLTSNGPVVFLINTAGYMFGGLHGIWYFEFIFLSATFLVLFYSLTQHIGPLSSFTVCATIAFILPSLFEGGNHIELYTLFFQAIGLAGFLNYFKRQEFTLLSVYMIGIGAALAFFTKPFTLLFWTPFFFIALIRVLYTEGLYTAFTRMLTILIGFFIPFVLVIPWLNINNALESCFNQMLFLYVDYVSLISMQTKIDTLIVLVSSFPFVLMVFITLAAFIKMAIVRFKPYTEIKRVNVSLDDVREPVNKATRKLDKTEFPFGPATPLLMIANLLAAALLFVTMAITADQSNHILMQAIICLVVPLAYVVQFFIKSIYAKNALRGITSGALIVLLIAFIWFPGAITSVEHSQAARGHNAELRQQEELISAIKASRAQSNQEDDQVDEPMVVFGSNCWVYTATDSYSATRYAYQKFSQSFGTNLNEDFYRQIGIAGNTTDQLLLAGRKQDGLIDQFPQLSEYELIFQNDSYVLYRKSGIIVEQTVEDVPAQ